MYTTLGSSNNITMCNVHCAATVTINNECHNCLLLLIAITCFVATITSCSHVCVVSNNDSVKTITPSKLNKYIK